ncbi:MAG: class II fructose-bisphosphatase [Deltaproteobacteria bacterium]|nr:MAG: class II fructose-bisphosphatase [Deltaproteobacteria bacterium]
MERNLALELVRVTEAAALAAARESGRGDETAPERVAAEAISRVFSTIGVQGEIVVGDPHQRAGDPLAVGSRLGDGGQEVDIAVDPLEGGLSCALGGPNAMSIMALGTKGSFLRCPPNTYMEKIATGADGIGIVGLDKSPAENLKALAEKRSMYVRDLCVVILDRPRHDELIEEVRAAGARVRLIPHGDVAAAMAAARKDSDVDLLMGIGGASQGVLSAAAIKCMGGVMECRFAVRNQQERNALYECGLGDVDRILTLDDMVGGSVLFAATGVTNGEYLRGVQFFKGGAVSHSVVMRSESGTVRLLETYHRFDYRPVYD